MSDSSSSDDEFDKFAAASVSIEDLTRGWDKSANKGKQVLARKDAPKSDTNNQTDADKGEGTDAATVQGDEGNEPAPLSIVERRIGAALDARLERILPKELTTVKSSKRPSHSTPSQDPDPDHNHDLSVPEADLDLGSGVRLFRRAKRNAPVTLPKQYHPDQGVQGPCQHLTDDLRHGVATKRTRIEISLLQRLLQQKPGQHQAPSSSGLAAQQQPAQQEKPQGVGEEVSDAGLSPVEAFQASIRRAIKQLSKSLGAKDQVKALKKALKHSAVEGAAILEQAEAEARVAAGKAVADAAEALAIEGRGKKKKKKKKKGGDGGEEGQAVVKMEGVVIEPKGRFGLKDVPADVRTARLIGLTV